MAGSRLVVSHTHAALIPSVPLAVGTCGLALEDVLAMSATERLLTLGLARPPGNPQDRRPSIGSLALPGHLFFLLAPNRGGETPGLEEPYGRSSSPGMESGSPLLCPRVGTSVAWSRGEVVISTQSIRATRRKSTRSGNHRAVTGHRTVTCRRE